MSNNLDASTLDFYYHQYKEAVFGNLFTGMVYGAYIIAYVTSTYVLLRKPGFTSSLPRMFMLGITTFMFALGIIALVLVTVANCQVMKATLVDSSDWWSEYYIVIVWGPIPRLMYILCDIVCAWRTVVLWNRDKRVIAILLFLILGSTAAAVWDLYFTIAPLMGPTNWSIESTGRVGERALLFLAVPTLATNLLCTGLIAWKAWKRHIPVREHFRKGSGTVRVDRVFALLIESGFIYCCIWVIYTISAFGVFLDPGFTFMAGVAGLYPTIIIILIGTQMSPVEHYSTHSAEMQLTRVSALGSPSYSNISRPVITIQHEYASDSDAQVPSIVFTKSADDEKAPLSVTFGQ
jgi:hypothetical protein